MFHTSYLCLDYYAIMHCVQIFWLRVFFKIGYNNTAAGIAGDIDNCTSHIKDSVDTCNQGNTVNRQTNGSQDHGQHDHTCTGTPAVPMEASVAVRTTVSIWVGVSVMP